MEFSFPTILIVPLGLGLLGFIEPCTIGGHLIFLRAVTQRSPLARSVAILTFTLVRTLTMGSFGALVALLGQQLIEVQTTLWLIFGSLYVLVGLAYGIGAPGRFELRIEVLPSAWKAAENPVVLAVAFGLNIPACAAPILFGLIGLAASSGAVTTGFATMAVFGLALSFPLAVIAIFPAAWSLTSRLAAGRAAVRRAVAVVFVALGFWSIWFGLFVDPADWAAI